MLDDIYKTTVVLITEHYVKDENSLAAGEAIDARPIGGPPGKRNRSRGAERRFRLDLATSLSLNVCGPAESVKGFPGAER